LVEVVGDHPEAERYDIRDEEEVRLTTRGRRQRDRQRRAARPQNVETIAVSVDPQQRVYVQKGEVTPRRLSKQVGFLLRMLATKNDKTAEREDFKDREGKALSRDNMRQRATRLRKELRNKLEIDSDVVAQAIQTNDSGESVTLDTRFLHVRLMSDDPQREPGFTTGYTERDADDDS
jgi:hypothetical protein